MDMTTSTLKNLNCRFLNKKIFWLMAASALALNTTSLEAGNLPTGGTITTGQGNISQSGSTMTVQQNTAKMAANWDSFSIGANHTVNFVQPNAQSVALNRVVGSDPSVIQGRLNANGQVFLLNPNGVLFTKTSQVNVGGILASTLALSDADFVAGNYKFEGNSSGTIINQGNIIAGKDGNGGDVVMIAAKISNEGTINAQGGTVALGAGSKVTLDLGGVVKLHIEEGILDALIENGGAIRSDGGTILLTAQAANALSRTVIKNTGVIEAQSLSTGPNGKIILKGGTSDSIEVGGTLDASAPNGGDGGFIETSAGQVNFLNDFKITTASSNGRTGNWLIDPEVIEIIAGTSGSTTGLPASGISQIGAITLSNALALSNVDLNATGWIDFTTNFNYAGATDTVLSLYAPVVKLGGNISTSTAMLGLNFGGTYSSISYAGNVMVYGASRTIATKGGDVNFYGNIGGGTTNSLSVDTKTGAVTPGDITHYDNVNGTFNATTVTTQIFSVGFTAGNKAVVIFDCTNGTLRVNGVIKTPTSGYVPLGHINFTEGTIVSLNASDTGADTVTITTLNSGVITIKPRPNGDITIPVGGLEITKIEYFTKSANAQNLGSNNSVDIYNTTNVGALANYTAVGGVFTIDATKAISVASDIRISTTNFLNNSNSSALAVGAGKTWQVWSSNPDPFTNDVRGGLVYNFKQYNATYGTTTVLGAGNGFLYTLAPQISFSLINNLSKVYDASNNATGLTGHYLTSGAVDGDTIGVDGANPLPNTGLYFSHNVGSGINITATGINVASLLAYNTSLAKPVYGYGLASTTASGNIGVITKANISAITGIIANNKVYDGNNTATLNVSGAGYTGGYAGDDLFVATSSGTFNNENVGTGKPVAITGLTLGGSDAGNYNLLSSTASTTANITKLALTSITGITAADRKYNAGTVATLNYATPIFGNLVDGDTLTITSAIGSFANKDANTNPKTVTISSIVLGGSDAGNYSLPTVAPTTTATISKADINFISGITANNKTYDSLTTASLNTNLVGIVFDGKFAGDTLTVQSSVGNFVNKNVGTGKIVNITGLTLGGTDAGNYNLLVTTASASANITKANISAITGITADNKVYSSTPTATLNVGLAGFTGRFAGDVLEVATSSGVFAEEHVGLAKTVNITGLTLGGTDSGNYNLLSTTATAYADITKATITAIEGITANNRKYNATTNATLNTSGVSISFTGAVAGDDLTVATSTGTFINKNVGDGKRVDITNLSLGGTDAENYILSNTTAVTSANITKADISSITGILALNKVYDGNDTAALNLAPAVFNGRFSGDDLTIASPTTGTFRTTGTVIGAHVGTNKIVDITGLTLGGLDAGNYNLVINYATALANISALGINSVSEITGITANNKPYDTLTTATLNISGAVIPGIVLGDDVTVDISSTTANFNDKYVGVGKPVSINGLKLGGDDAVNYVLLNDHASTTANITAINITEITGITANNKIYDTFTTATLNLGAAAFTGRLGTDNLTVATSTGAFINKNVGDNKRVDITGLTLGGSDAINYNLVKTTAITQANISKANIAAITGIAAQDKVYDSYRTATLDTTGAGFTGILVGDNLLVDTSTGNFIDKNVGNGKTVNITGLTLGGTDAGNYNLQSTVATSAANITKADISAITNITANNKVYNSNSDATLDVSTALFTGIQGSDTLTVATATGTFTEHPHVGNDKDVLITGLTLGGSNAGNYNLVSTTSNATADITPAHIANITGITAQNKIYDGDDTATLNVGAAGFTNAFTGDDIVVATATGNFSDQNVGVGKTVNITGLTLGGADAENYILDSDIALTTANISKLRLTDITNIYAEDRIYNAGTNATLLVGKPVFGGLIGDDDLSITSAVGTFANKKVGVDKTVTVSSIVLGGLDAGNYDLPVVAPTTTASISKANILNITGITANSKTYDGNNIATLNVGNATFNTQFAGDTLTVAGATGKFTNQQVGVNKTVNISDLTLGGEDAMNYTLIDTTAIAYADIIAGADLVDLNQFIPKSSPVPTFPVFQPMITLFGQSKLSYNGLNFLLPPLSIVSTEIVSTAPAWTFFPIGLAEEEPLVKLRSKNGSDYVETDKRDAGYIIRSGEGPTNIIVVGDGVRLELKSSSAK